MVHYAASKAGVISVTRTAAQVLAPLKITSNCICPGVVDTPMWTKIDADWTELEGWETGEAWKRRIVGIPLGRPEQPADVAGVVSFLASPDSDYMTGQAIHIDGGLQGLLRIGLNANEVFLAIHDRLPRLKEANAGTQDPELFTCVDFFIYGILLGRRLEDEGEES